MAVETVVTSGVSEILKRVSSFAVNEVTLIWNFKDELKDLHSTLNMILDVIEDAEKKQVSQSTVRSWMEDLKALAYDAEDILDEYAYESSRHHQKLKEYQSSSVFNKVRKVLSKPPLFVVSWKLAHKIKNLNEKFSKIAKRRSSLGLLTIDLGLPSSSHQLMMESRVTFPVVEKNWEFLGREIDKSKIINITLDENSAGLVIPIVGLGGIGKTTLAQHVFNDEAISNHFDIKMWACVSHPFELTRVLTQIGDSIGVKGTTIQIRDALNEKKFLLVLDDVWNESFNNWSKLKAPFLCGARGSRILVTTRSVRVARLMEDRFPLYELRFLNVDDSWSLFREVAFGTIHGAIENSEMVKMGKEMVRRCGGLPLALIFLGGLLRLKKKEAEWKMILDTELWHQCHEGEQPEILPSLKLSYDYLPSHLKVCFSYCCLFPKDSLLVRERLVQLWMAEGFIPEEKARSMEDIGNFYFQCLLSSFFLKDAKKGDDGEIETCKMHDLVHDLARSVVGKNKCLLIESDQEIGCISEATLRVNLINFKISSRELAPILEAFKKAKNLRTIFMTCESFDIRKAFEQNKRLRVLSLHGYRSESYTLLGSTYSATGLNHLRPNHLRFLELHGFCFPERIGRSIFLQTLSSFKVGDRKKNKDTSGVGLEELEGLNLLRGNLSILNLQNVRSGIDAYRANLKEKKNLCSLLLQWGVRYFADPGGGNDHHEVVLEGLRPPPNLRKLEIHGFEGAKLPSWIQEDSSCFPNLVELILLRCRFEKVAGLGALPSLRYLSLSKMKAM